MCSSDLIHSVDSLKLAQQIDRIAAELNIRPKICLQVKILADPQKYGWTVPELLIDLPQLDRLQHIDIQGLMAIPPLGLTPAQTQALFESVRDLSLQIRQQSGGLRLDLPELSMGMSGDYRSAITAGSTIIRLGSILFGDRSRNGDEE